MVGINQGYGYGGFSRINTRGPQPGARSLPSKGASSGSGGIFNNSYTNIYSAASAMGTMSKLRPMLDGEGPVFQNTASSLSVFFEKNNGYSDFAKSISGFAVKNMRNLSVLKDSASSLGRAAGAINNSILVSTQSDVATVKSKVFTGNSEPLAFEIQVNGLASGQQSVSSVFESGANSTFRLGTNSMDILTSKGSFRIDFDVAARDTNRDSLNAIAGSINDADIGMTAEVEDNQGESRLLLSSNAQGADSAFDIIVPTGSSAAEKLGMSETRQASDAEYIINGQRFYSNTNTVPLPLSNGSAMTLHKTGGTTVRQVLDASGVVSAMQDFAQAYNNAVSHLGSGAGQGSHNALDMINGMNKLSDNETARLTAMGIRMDSENGLTVDAGKLTNAVRESPGVVKSALSGRDGVSASIEQGADRAMRIPTANYADFSSLLDDAIQNTSLISMMLPQPGFLIDYAL